MDENDPVRVWLRGGKGGRRERWMKGVVVVVAVIGVRMAWLW